MISLAKLRAHLGIAATDTSKDTILEDLEAGAVAFMERETGLSYPERDEGTIYLTGDGGAALWLPHAPIAGTDITVLERWAITDDGTAVPVGARGRRIYRTDDSAWTRGADYQVTYTSGYDADGEPADARLTVIQLVELAWNQRGKAGMQSESIGGYSYSRADLDALPTHARAFLSRRKARVG